MKNIFNNKIVIEINLDEHFIEGNSYTVFLKSSPDGLMEHTSVVPLICGCKASDVLELMDCINGLKIRLEQLGCSVKIVNKVNHDPNFENQAEADKYLQEM